MSQSLGGLSGDYLLSVALGVCLFNLVNIVPNNMLLSSDSSGFRISVVVV